MKIKGVYVKAGQKPEVIEFENKYEELKKLVGGRIEHVMLDNETGIYCNEEGKLLSLPGNRRLDNGDVIAGDFIIVGDDGGEVDVSLREDQIEKYMSRFDKIEHYTIVTSLGYDMSEWEV